MERIVLDPALEEIVRSRGDSYKIDLEAMPLEQALRHVRVAASQARPAVSLPTDISDITIDGSQGVSIRVRLYYPEASVKPSPLLVHLHGGGFIGGTVELEDLRCCRLAREVGCIVASVDYRLAPEHPFPAAIEDALAAWATLTSHANDLGIDPDRCAISGSSAGGHIAIGVTLLARSRGIRMPVLQLLTYPVIDPSMSTNSYHNFGDGPFLTSALMAWYWKQYGAGGGDRDEELWAPLTAEPKGLPPAHVITAEYDVLRDEGEAYAAHLLAAGIPATVRRYANMAHGFLTIIPDHPTSAAALAGSVAALRNNEF